MSADIELAPWIEIRQHRRMSKQERLMICQVDGASGCCPGLAAAPLDDVRAAEPAKLIERRSTII